MSCMAYVLQRLVLQKTCAGNRRLIYVCMCDMWKVAKLLVGMCVCLRHVSGAVHLLI